MIIFRPHPHVMEVPMEEGTEQVVSGGGAGSVNVSLHPLVVMNVSDHFTRVKVQSQVPPSIISGIYIYIYPCEMGGNARL